jgi:hypothetical protein
VEERERSPTPASQVRSPGIPVAPSRDAPISESIVGAHGEYHAEDEFSERGQYMRKFGWGVFVVVVMFAVSAWAAPNADQFNEKFLVKYSSSSSGGCYMTLVAGGMEYDTQNGGGGWNGLCQIWPPGSTLRGKYVYGKGHTIVSIQVLWTNEAGKVRADNYWVHETRYTPR